MGAYLVKEENQENKKVISIKKKSYGISPPLIQERVTIRKEDRIC